MSLPSHRNLLATAAIAAMAVTSTDGFALQPSKSHLRIDRMRLYNDDNNNHQQDHSHSTRRNVLKTTKSAVLGALCGWILEPNLLNINNPNANAVMVTDPSNAPDVPTADSIWSFVAGTVTIPKEFDFEAAQGRTQVFDPTGHTMTPVPALYVTVRPKKPDNVSQAILQGSFGKSPPVLSARFEQPTFPFAFQLTPKDYTLEGQPSLPQEDPWWLEDDLVVSARLDMDGIAATRGPEDLVGRTVYLKSKGGEAVDLALVGRGAFGKFATKK